MNRKLSHFLISVSGHSPALAMTLSEAERIRLVSLGMTLIVPITVAGLGASAKSYSFMFGSFL